MAASDYLIVGGGVIGCSLARRLAMAGARVTLLERGRPGAEASWAAAGILEPTAGSYGGLPLLAHWLAGLHRYRDFVAAIQDDSGLAIEYRITGRLRLTFDESELPVLQETRRAQLEAGIPCELWSAERVREEEPNVAPGVAGALYFPDHGLVDNRALMAALPVAASRRGAALRSDAAVTDLLMEGERVVGVRVGSERLPAGAVVIAAGCWSGQLGLRPAPVAPSKGQMVALADGAALCRHIVSVPGGSLAPRGDGRLTYGATKEDVGFDKRVTAGAVARLLAGAIRICPAVADLAVQQTWAGLRPVVQADQLPVLGAAAPGLFYATGHYSMGILSAPATAEAMSGLLLEGRSPLPIETFSPLRFAAP
jgi:glycine oxidase